jgi:hypothetical protein
VIEKECKPKPPCIPDVPLEDEAKVVGTVAKNELVVPGWAPPVKVGDVIPPKEEVNLMDLEVKKI